MYHWIADKQFLKDMRRECTNIINQLVQVINNEGVMEVEYHVIGSCAKNMETQNANEPVDTDYNLEIKNVSFDINDCKKIKDYVMTMFNKVLTSRGWGTCSDSTSALTTKRRYFTQGNQTPFSIDLGIIAKSKTNWYRLIHVKDRVGSNQKDSWIWNEGPDSSELFERAKWLKGAKHNHWVEVRENYLDRKNMYLGRGDKNHPSFNCYIESVNEVYYKYRKK
ncbi:MAG: hypothetical protein MR357_05265 [Anaeroplasma sp.]|nr:hypothetical protein [Anaeroplasma sp.]